VRKKRAVANPVQLRPATWRLNKRPFTVRIGDTRSVPKRARLCVVAEDSVRLNVTLSPEQGAKLARIARRTHVREGTLASSLLSHAIDEADPDAGQIVALLDRIPGAWGRIDAGIEDARAGRTVAFGERERDEA
jgi:hypothetical protein